ncbi:MAG: FecR family protein [Desulfobacterales bacterium]|nr:FecR family protein [Pseudomonadota bacterium]MBU4357339.1 FecR family protein [Pseudomonadota bacterium]MCG2773081.1 FecR family protein [Desulfobacterales bacterium]
MTRKYLLVVIAIVALLGVFALSAHASVVGRFTLIKGKVDVLKGGKLPAIAAQVQDGVETGDVIRTKSGAKAQLSMVDASVITLAPESRLAIADYQYNPARGERRAVLRLFRGLVHTVVNRIIKTEEPDFLMETHTATIGVRGTDWYTLLGPNSTGVYLPRGILGVSSNLPTVPALLLLQSSQFTQIIQGRQPSLAQALTPEILRMLDRLMDTGLTDGGLGFGQPARGTGAQYQTPLTMPGSPDQKILQQTIPPVLVPQHQAPPPVQSAPVQPGPHGSPH